MISLLPPFIASLVGRGSGLSDRMMHKVEEDVSVVLPAAKEALARGNINFIRYELNELLQLFRINLDPNCLRLPQGRNRRNQSRGPCPRGCSCAQPWRSD